MHSLTSPVTTVLWESRPVGTSHKSPAKGSNPFRITYICKNASANPLGSHTCRKPRIYVKTRRLKSFELTYLQGTFSQAFLNHILEENEDRGGGGGGVRLSASPDDRQLSQQIGTVPQRFLQRLLPAPAADFLVVAAQQNLRHGPAAVFRRTRVMRKIEQAPRSGHVMRNQERLVHLRELLAGSRRGEHILPDLPCLPRRLRLAEGSLVGRRVVPQRPRLQARDRVHNQRRGTFSARHHVIAHANLFGGEMLGDAFVHAFRPPADQDDSLERRVAPRGLLPEKPSRRGKQHDRYLLRALCALSFRFFSRHLLRA